MRVLILVLPALMMCGSVMWMFSVTLLLSNKTGRVKTLRSLFAQMSIAVGGMFALWGLAVIPANIVHIGYPLVIIAVGLLLIVQGWAFKKYNLF